MSDFGSPPNPASAVHGARLLAALEATKTAATRATSEQRSASTGLARQRVDLEAVQESVEWLIGAGKIAV